MLSFFRRYEKTLFLVLFLPTVIGMGITSVIVSVLNDPKAQNQNYGKVFGEPIDPLEWETTMRPYSKLVRAEQDDQFRFFAFYKAAKDAGIRVPDSRVAEDLINELSYTIAQMKARDRILEEGINIESQEGQNKFRQYLLQYLTQRDFTEKDYKHYLERRGLQYTEFETFQKREKLREALTTTIREAATVSPEEMWKEYNEKAHQREAELAYVDATAYVPSATTVVTDAEAEAYYKAQRESYDEPRRIDLEYVAAPFERTRQEVPVPTDEVLKGYYEKHLGDYTSTVGTTSVVTSYVDCKAKVQEAYVTDQARDRAQGLLEEVAAKLDEQRKSGKLDLAAACKAVAALHTGSAALVTGRTGLLESDEILVHPLIKGFAAERWATNEGASETRSSDPLRSEVSVYVVRTAAVKERRSPTYDEVKDQVRKDYVAGSERELKRYYQQNEFKYATKDRWKLDVVVADFALWASKDPNLEKPTPEQLATFWKEQGAKKWPGKDAATVGSAAMTAAWQVEAPARKCLEAVRKAGNDGYSKDKKANIDLKVPTIEKSSFLRTRYREELDREGLEKDADVKTAATFVTTAPLQEPSGIFELPDGKGLFLVVPLEKLDQKIRDLADVKDLVRKDVLNVRGYERAKAAAEKLVLDLKDLRGDALVKAVAAKGLTTQKTGLFKRAATALPGVKGDATQIVGETFQCEVDGGFERSVADDAEKRVCLVRCARKQDPEKKDFAMNERVFIRKELLERKRNEFVQREYVAITLAAKGISDAHVKWARERRDGADGRVSSKVRQVFVPNDRATTDRWLEDAARKKIEEAQADLAKDVKWDAVVFKFSEEEATRGRGGERREVERGELVAEFGEDFEGKVFQLPLDKVSQPIKSKKGFHLVKVTKLPTAAPDERGRPGEARMSFKHLLVKTDAKMRNLPAEIADKAKSLSKAKIEAAQKRLEAGEPFSKVAADLGDEGDARAKGEAFTLPHLSPLVRTALKQPLEPTEIEKVEPVEVALEGGGKEWHLMLCAHDSQDREPSWQQGTWRPRLVFTLVGQSRDDCLRSRGALEQWIKARAAENREPSFPEVLKHWKAMCQTLSDAPNKSKEGAFGVVSVDAAVRGLGEKVFEAVGATSAGKRTGIIETEAGFHVLEVVSTETKAKDDVGRDREVADLILRGTSWTEE